MNADPLLSAALRHWGARTLPFHDQPGQVPLLTPAWEAALGLLNQTAALRSVMLLTGDNGVGKSALAAPWLESLEPKLYLPLAITQATLSATGLMAVLLHKLGQPATLYRNRNLVALEKALAELGRLTPVLVRDEAQQYPPGALEEIRLLLGLNLSRQAHLRAGLVGRPLSAGYFAPAAPSGPVFAHCRSLHFASAGARPNRALPGAWAAAGGTGTSWLESGRLGLAQQCQWRRASPA